MPDFHLTGHPGRQLLSHVGAKVAGAHPFRLGERFGGEVAEDVIAPEAFTRLTWALGVTKSVRAQAQFLLGRMFDEGRGLPVDREEANSRWVRAERDGYPVAAKIALWNERCASDKICAGLSDQSTTDTQTIATSRIDDKTIVFTWGTPSDAYRDHPDNELESRQHSTRGDDGSGKTALLVVTENNARLFDFRGHENLVGFSDRRANGLPYFEIYAYSQGNCWPVCGQTNLLIDPETLVTKFRADSVLKDVDLGESHGFCMSGDHLYTHYTNNRRDRRSVYMFEHVIVHKTSLELVDSYFTLDYCNFETPSRYEPHDLQAIRDYLGVEDLDATWLYLDEPSPLNRTPEFITSTDWPGRLSWNWSDFHPPWVEERDNPHMVVSATLATAEQAQQEALKAAKVLNLQLHKISSEDIPVRRQHVGSLVTIRRQRDGKYVVSSFLGSNRWYG